MKTLLMLLLITASVASARDGFVAETDSILTTFRMFERTDTTALYAEYVDNTFIRADTLYRIRHGWGHDFIMGYYDSPPDTRWFLRGIKGNGGEARWVPIGEERILRVWRNASGILK